MKNKKEQRARSGTEARAPKRIPTRAQLEWLQRTKVQALFAVNSVRLQRAPN